MPDESTRTVLVSLGAGLGVSLAKIVAAVITGSAALAAEAAHSLADNANDLSLFMAQRRSSRPRDEQHPLGYGREAYFWALIAALGVLAVGAAFSLRDGIDELIHPSATQSFAVAYVVLAISTVFDLVSFRSSAGQMGRRARRHQRGFLEESRVTSEPSLRAVFLEDSVSVGGDVLACAALALNQLTGSSVPQGVAAVLIALLMIRVSLRLIQRSHDFLVGAWSGAAGGSQGRDVAGFTQPLRPAEEARLRAFLLGYPGVTAIRELLFTFVGPGRLWVVVRVDIGAGLRGAQVEALVRGIESGLKHGSEEIYRVDVVPIGGAQDTRVLPEPQSTARIRAFALTAAPDRRRRTIALRHSSARSSTKPKLTSMSQSHALRRRCRTHSAGRGRN
jgi:cation diffusion facilitator family transporter